MVGTEVEALQLEYSWIKEFDPRFNVKYRDDKSYPYLAVTMADEFPRVQVMRGAKRKGTRYFGPYAHAWAIRETVDLLLRVFPVRTCSNGVFKRAGQIGRPCLLGYIDKCSAPVRRPDRRRRTTAARRGLLRLHGGRHAAKFTRRLEREMREAAGRAGVRARGPAAGRHRRRSSGRWRRTPSCCADGTDADVFALADDELEAAVQVFHVRDGRIRGQRGWVVEKVEDVTDADLVEHLLQQVYGSRGVRPGTVARARRPSRARCWSRCCRPTPSRSRRWLSGLRGARVAVRVPQRGDKRALMETVRPQRRAGADAAQDPPGRRPDHAVSQALQEIQEALGLPEAPLRIECYDISTIQGEHTVGSMVVFEDGLARKSEYRKFTIRGPEGTARATTSRRMHEVHHPPVPALPRRPGAGRTSRRGRRARATAVGRPSDATRPPRSAARSTRSPWSRAGSGSRTRRTSSSSTAVRRRSRPRPRAMAELGIDDVALVRAGEAARGGLAAGGGRTR